MTVWATAYDSRRFHANQSSQSPLCVLLRFSLIFQLTDKPFRWDKHRILLQIIGFKSEVVTWILGPKVAAFSFTHAASSLSTLELWASWAFWEFKAD